MLLLSTNFKFIGALILAINYKSDGVVITENQCIKSDILSTKKHHEKTISQVVPGIGSNPQNVLFFIIC